MTNIIPVSDLRNYAKVLQQVTADRPIILTKNGRGAYALLDIEAYEKAQKLAEELAQAEKSIGQLEFLHTLDESYIDGCENGFVSEEELMALLEKYTQEAKNMQEEEPERRACAV